MFINVTGGVVANREIYEYIEYGKKKYPDRVIEGIHIHLDGDYVDLKFYFMAVPFERIRRITGYLTGTVDRWNDAKRAELADRVTHSVYDGTDSGGQQRTEQDNKGRW